VINIADRQKGRDAGPNVLHVPADADAITDMADKIEQMPDYTGGNIYGDGTSSDQIITILKEKFSSN
jgi:GDP/UDP-N,N'-diacetylbacillosamine 2-epimerase (hydrolysing)